MAEKHVKNMTKFERLTHQGFQRGFSLIEVLVALVILVIGLIGIFNLHIVAKRGSFESFQQTQASYYANDIINRMKLNRTQLANYGGEYTGELSKPNKVCDVAVGAISLCSPAETEAWDLYQWEQNFIGAAETVGGQNVGGLDSPTACIDINGSIVTVAVAWRGIREGAGTTYSGNECGKDLGLRRRIFVVSTVII
ncbi:type IV pilus modification protein PilV [Shewanella xiamenensis]|uniref:type IV pilus modification protein PilV n=1 Tax=Shewanella TaxID=22 RepID=UPI001CC74770|nr:MULTISPECIES: type IV pilus modification protein PilV [Shewanella]MCT8860239.1 type IV pilus modification protein PilV [Shewanella xiamenensis]MDN5500839.1 type IV pilus modification protein PilV [Shewanella sp.]MDN5527764.1 type IV pilus modification protein PilV [Shewanella sp.]UWG66811.1 type IV pilus modification protein PilV [Shewanella xiamenensis]